MSHAVSLFCCGKKRYSSPLTGLALGALLLFAPCHALANSGGVADVPDPGDYTGVYNQVGDVSGGNIDVDNVTGDSYGGFTWNGNATGNTAVINSGLVTKGIYGAYSVSGNVTDNIARMNGGRTPYLYGARTENGNASGNLVFMDGGKAARLNGGNSAKGDVTNNHIDIRGTSNIENPGFSTSFVQGGYTAQGNAIGNSVTISGNSEIKSSISGGVATDGVAKDNAVFVFGTPTLLESELNGAISYYGDAIDNAVYIWGGDIEHSIHGAVGVGENAKAIGNSVIINGGNISGGVTPAGIAGGSADGFVYGNEVILTAGTIKATIYGGISQKNKAIYNSIFIGGDAVLDPSSQLIGGIDFSLKNDARTGNTLTLAKSGVTVESIKNFQNLQFYLLSTVIPTDPVLTVTDTLGVDISTPAGAAPTNVLVSFGEGSPMQKGDTVVLLNATHGLTADSGLNRSITTWTKGISRLYTMQFEVDTNTLQVRVLDIGATPEAVRKSPAEGKLASAALITQGADLAAGQGISSARSATARAGSVGAASFGIMEAGTFRYNSGSHINANSLSLVAGLAKNWQAASSEMLGGMFFEAGFASYASYNALPTGAKVKATGNTRYFGAGVLGRLEKTDGASKGLYAEASIRAGGVYSDYKSDSLNSMAYARYSTNAAYYGAHIGAGFIWEISEKAKLDMFAKYFWNHTASTHANILGDSVRFKAVNSHRTRLGGRFTYAVSENISPFLGAAWEYEFNGTAKSVIAGENAPAPSMKGSTGIAELGFAWQPSAGSSFSMDLGVQGFVGKRQGVSGSLLFKFTF